MASRAATRDISVKLRGPEKPTACAEEEVRIIEKGEWATKMDHLRASVAWGLISSTYMMAHNLSPRDSHRHACT